MRYGVTLVYVQDMKKPESYDVRVKGRLVLSRGSLEDAMEIIQDLSEAYYNTGQPDPDTITMELNNGEDETIFNEQWICRDYTQKNSARTRKTLEVQRNFSK